jgi:hypothetical protein
MKPGFDADDSKGEYEYDLDGHLLTCIDSYEHDRREFWTEAGAAMRPEGSCDLFHEAERIAKALLEMSEHLRLVPERPGDFDAFRWWAGEHMRAGWSAKALAWSMINAEEFAQVAGDLEAIQALLDRKLREREDEYAAEGQTLWDDILRAEVDRKERPPDDSPERLVWERLVIEMARECADESIPRAANRLFVLAGLLQEVGPSERALRFLRRVAKCFVWAFDAECVIMCRGAIDAALEEAVPDRKCRPKPGGGIGLKERIECARELGWLSSDAMRDDADRIREAGNRILHDNPEQELRPVEMIRKTLTVLSAIDRGVHPESS